MKQKEVNINKEHQQGPSQRIEPGVRRLPLKPSQKLLWKLGIILGSFSFFGFVPSAFAQMTQLELQLVPTRSLASLAFPSVDEESDTDDIIENYEVYLRYLIDAGNRVSRSRTKRIAAKYTKLKSYNEDLAANFLKGLRYEMVHRVQITGVHPRRFHSRSSGARKWVGRFLRDWEQEIDEYLYRAYAFRLIRKES